MESNKQLIELKLNLDDLLKKNNKLAEAVKIKIYELDEKICLHNTDCILDNLYIKEIQTLFKDIKKANLEIFRNEKLIKKIELKINKLEEGIDKEKILIDFKSIVKNNIYLYKIIEEYYKEESLKYQEEILSIKKEYDIFKQDGGNTSEWKKQYGEELFKTINHTKEYIRRKCNEDIMYSFYDLVFKIKNLAGEVVDFNLQTNQKNGVDGWIKGDLAKIVINTVPAGGYNIQRFHFRTLIHIIETYHPVTTQ